MANTVNDVMNVIASPDYGIKNIAGTNQEILAILEGTHNSKNNIHAIVNDIKVLLQELVGTETKNKTVEIKGKPSKINNRHIKDILDETKGIRKSIDNLTKAFIKKEKSAMTAVAKLSDKSSEKVANALINSMKKQNKGNRFNRLSGIIDSFAKLKDISLKDIIIGKQKMKIITKIFKDVGKYFNNIKKKDLDNVIKLISSTPEMINTLKKIGRKINKIIKNNTIEKLSDILVGEKNSILSLSKILQKNKKLFDNANKVLKNISTLTSSLTKSIFKLFFASLFAKSADKGFKSIESAINKLITISTKITKNKKYINEGIKVAKKTTVLIGNLLVTSINLTIAAVIGIPALLGAKLLSKIVDKTLPIAKKLTKNNKNISKAIGSALLLTAFTGIMVAPSLLLATIGVIGIPALLGSVLMYGIIKLNILTCKMISKSLKHIVIGSIGMAIMSTSLFLFGVALNKITTATKGVSFKQIGVIATITVLLGGAVAILGIPVVAPFILLGSLSMAAMGLALIPYAKTLDTLSKSTKTLKMKDVLVITGSLLLFGLAIAAMGPLIVPIALGSVGVNKIVGILYKLAKSLKIISDIGKPPTELINQNLETIGVIGKFFIKNQIKRSAIKQARRYKKIIRPFGDTIKYLSELKEINNNAIQSSIKSLGALFEFLKSNSFNRKERRRVIKTLSVLNYMTSLLSKIQNNIKSSDMSSVGDNILNTINGVDKVDISKVHAVTNMFNAFNGINKSENIINKFTESVKDFTETCKNLMDAMSDNTNAINNIENIGSNSSTTKEIKETNIIEKSSNGDDNKTGGIRISNVDEIAKTIAEKINGVLSVDVPDTQVQLLINGTGGNEWIISRY